MEALHMDHLERKKSPRTRYKNQYRILEDGKTMAGTLSTGVEFIFDKSDFELIKKRTWYTNVWKAKPNLIYVADSKGIKLHKYLLQPPAKYEVDHIDLNTLNNCRSNLRICTHQQNQCNQDLQRNNRSGIVGVNYYPPRKKHRARIKTSQTEIHLGYYENQVEAIQARNEAVKLMFGEYGRLNEVPEAPEWIKKEIYNKCSRFFDKAAVSIHSAK